MKKVNLFTHLENLTLHKEEFNDLIECYEMASREEITTEEAQFLVNLFETLFEGDTLHQKYLCPENHAV